MLELEQAWHWREERGILAQGQAVRVFHGPGENGGTALRDLAIDRFGDHYWITTWKAGLDLSRVIIFLKSKNAHSAVLMHRPERGLSEESKALFGNPPLNGFEIKENSAKFMIRLLGGRHPGLFLDHEPLRRWLSQSSQGWRVLNTFAFTGSLSVAAALGGAEHVTTLDLSKSALTWAKENWALNHLPEEKSRFIAGDFFEWLPRFKKEGARFDCLILDPPSFSRGKHGEFSTAQDLQRLHELAFGVLKNGGILATSINSANISRAKFEFEIQAAAKATARRLRLLWGMDLPETFPTQLNCPQDRYLKGFVLRVESASDPRVRGPRNS